MLSAFKIWILSHFHKRKYKVYESLDFLPIWNFKQIEITNDLRYLIKNIDYEQLPIVYLNLKKAWEKIYNSFIQEANPNFLTEFKNGFVSIEAKRMEYLFLKGCIEILSKKEFISIENQKELIKKIRDLDYKFNDINETEYYNSIIDLSRQMIGIAKMLEFKSHEFENKYTAQKSESVDIEDIMTMFSQYFGILMNAKTLTVKQYLSYLKKYNKAVTETQTQTANGRRNNQ